MPGGRPSSYKPEYCDLLIKLAEEQGYHLEAFAGHIGVDKTTIYEWKSKHQEFSNAVNIARVKMEQWWLLKGQELMQTKGANAGIYQILVKNICGWSDKKEIKSEIKAEVKVLTELSDDEILKEAERLGLVKKQE